MRLFDARWATGPLLLALALGAPNAACSDAANDETDDDSSAVPDAAIDALADDGTDAATTDPEEDAAASPDAASEADAGDEPDAASEADAGGGADGSSGGATYLDIVLNEVQSNPTAGQLASDFVELYNRSDASYTFPAGAWYLTDSDAAHVFYVPGGTVIEGHGRLVLLPDDETVPTTDPLPPAGAIACTQDGVNSAAFGLGKADAVSLYYTGADSATPEQPVDTTSWTAHVTTRVRLPDGGDWDATDTHTPTPGLANE